MVQLKVLSGKKSGTELTASRFPFQIGRAETADLPADEPGVWDRHLEINFSSDGFTARSHATAIFTLNGKSAQDQILRNGDVIEIGALKIRFSLSPVQQRSLFLRE